MKKLFTLFIMLISINVHSQSGWFTQPVPVSTTTFMWEVEMLDANTVYISADGGRVLKSTNGGTNWSTTTFTGATDMSSINFPTENIGYTAGAQGRIYKTTNSGANWFPLSSPTSNNILSVRFINETTGFIGGGQDNDGEIFKTTNGGMNWTEYGPGQTFGQVVFMNFPSANIGYAAGTHNMIMKTSNGGINWTIQQTGLGDVTFFSVFFINENTGYLTTPFPGNILKTTNGGSNWNSIYSNIQHFTVSAFFTTPDTGYVTGAVGNSTMVMKTTNAGVNWLLEPIDFDGHMNSIDFINTSTGYIACDEGILCKTTNGGTTVGITNNDGSIPDNFTLFQNYPNPFNPKSIINYELQITNFASLKVFDLLGNEIATLVYGKQNSGSYEVEFDGSNFPSGVYYYTLKSGGVSQTRKMLLVK